MTISSFFVTFNLLMQNEQHCWIPSPIAIQNEFIIIINISIIVVIVIIIILLLFLEKIAVNKMAPKAVGDTATRLMAMLFV